MLEKLCYSSSQKVSFAKSTVVFSLNVDPTTRGDICHLLNIRESSEIGKYLGIPIKATPIKASEFDYLAEKILSKLAC